MDILILEDDVQRQRQFQQALIGTNCVIVDTVEDTIAQLASHQWDYLFLDHDLGGQQYVLSGEGTGYAVAEWLGENVEMQPPNIIIHSLNPAGSANIKKALPNAIVAPGCWTSLQITESE
jgi:hypothetical protein